mmetsp:Transcript_65997/g.136655  ORF Transcript_65997/g.136655 Transcript_65997/m.136655 type:complete len:537 (-) Transcript_65997:52-1662(-)
MVQCSGRVDADLLVRFLKKINHPARHLRIARWMVAMVHLVHLFGCSGIIIKKTLSMSPAQGHLKPVPALPMRRYHEDAPHQVLIQPQPLRQLGKAAREGCGGVPQKRHRPEAMRDEQRGQRITIHRTDHDLCWLKGPVEALGLNCPAVCRCPMRPLLLPTMAGAFHVLILEAKASATIEDVRKLWVRLLRVRLLESWRAAYQVEHILGVYDMWRPRKFPFALSPVFSIAKILVLQALSSMASEHVLKVRTKLLVMPIIVFGELLASAKDAGQRCVHNMRRAKEIPLAANAAPFGILVLRAVTSKSLEHVGQVRTALFVQILQLRHLVAAADELFQAGRVLHMRRTAKVPSSCSFGPIQVGGLIGETCATIEDFLHARILLLLEFPGSEKFLAPTDQLGHLWCVGGVGSTDEASLASLMSSRRWSSSEAIPVPGRLAQVDGVSAGPLPQLLRVMVFKPLRTRETGGLGNWLDWLRASTVATIQKAPCAVSSTKDRLDKIPVFSVRQWGGVAPMRRRLRLCGGSCSRRRSVPRVGWCC